MLTYVPHVLACAHHEGGLGMKVSAVALKRCIERIEVLEQKAGDGDEVSDTASLTSLRESIDRVLSVCGGKPDFLKVDAIIDLVRPIVDRNKWLEGVNEKAEASALEWRDRHIGGHEHYLNHLNDALQDGDV